MPENGEKTTIGELNNYLEYQEIPGRIQMERLILVEIFRKKSNTFRGSNFFPFLPKQPKFSVPFVWITSARLHVERKWKIYRYFVNGTTQSRFFFRQKKKKYQYHLTEIFHRNVRSNGKRLGLISQKATLHVQHTSFVHFFAVVLTTDVKFQKPPKIHVLGNVVRVLVSIFFHCSWFSPCIGGRKHFSFSHRCYEIFIFVVRRFLIYRS